MSMQTQSMAWRHVTALGLLVLAAACAPRTERFDLSPAAYESIPEWSRQDLAPALGSFRRSCDKLLITAAPSKATKLTATKSDWQPACTAALATDPANARYFFETHFTPYAVNEGERTGLFTGYYEPLLHGSRKRTEAYRYPVYALPPEVKEGSPVLSRTDIDNGALKGRGLELLWVNDRVDLFFAQVQGSSRVQLPDGTTTRIAYAGKNNHPYVAIGKVLKGWGELEDVTMFSIRDWLKRNPSRVDELLQENPSYVFFREAPGSEGPTGAQGVIVTPELSLAIDPRYLPYGLPVYVMTDLPETPYNSLQPYNRLLIAQDTGGAIRGSVRGDIFFGAGERAEALAGMMKGRGTNILLVPNPLAARL